MKIEKVCRYVPVVTGLKSDGSQAGSTVRHMLLSLPRVRFLEGGETEYYHKYQPPVEEPVVKNPNYSTVWCDAIKAEPLTDKERDAMRMKNDGFTYNAIANKLSIGRSSVAKLLNRARVKIAYIAQKG
jgi:hypothetical protein